MSIPPGEHAAAIVAHYLKHLTLATGRRWTSQNDRDMQTLAELLRDQADPDAGDTIPPYQREPPQLDTRVTEELDYGDPAFTRWRQEKAEEERIAQSRRMMRR